MDKRVGIDLDRLFSLCLFVLVLQCVVTLRTVVPLSLNYGTDGTVKKMQGRKPDHWVGEPFVAADSADLTCFLGRWRCFCDGNAVVVAVSSALSRAGTHGQKY
jgi:hypothetical protein